MVGFAAGLPGGDLGLVLTLSASAAELALISVLRLGYSFLLVGGPAGLGGPPGRGGAGRAGGGRPGGVFFTVVGVELPLLSASEK